jgi:hypothetical protein
MKTWLFKLKVVSTGIHKPSAEPESIQRVSAMQYWLPVAIVNFYVLKIVLTDHKSEATSVSLKFTLLSVTLPR